VRDKLNAPWGLAISPADFGVFSNCLLVGNFGDGTINAYSLNGYKFLGQLQVSAAKRVRIDGLWGMAFGNGVENQPTNALFVAAGPLDETHGLYAKIVPKK
jgi:uncharacterized protein (TIGR03118 family)